jgi:hypothetical protein
VNNSSNRGLCIREFERALRDDVALGFEEEFLSEDGDVCFRCGSSGVGGTTLAREMKVAVGRH